MYKPKYFSLQELLYSDTAIAHKTDNSPSWEAVINLSEMCRITLDPLREAWCEPLIVSSGYRTPIVNSRVGGSETSDHMEGLAVDLRIEYPSKARLLKLFKLIQQMAKDGEIIIDQCIYYPKKRIIHIGVGSPFRYQFYYKE